MCCRIAFGKHKIKKVMRKTGGPYCGYCGRRVYRTVPHRSPVRLAIDHIKPLSKGGTNKHPNLLTSCNECNQAKADMSLKAFRRTLSNGRVGEHGYQFFFEIRRHNVI